MKQMIANLTLISLLSLSLTTHASEDCKTYINELREVKANMEANLLEQSKFHANLSEELEGTYGVLKGWEGQRLYIKPGGFDALKLFVEQVDSRTQTYDQNKAYNLKRIEDITFKLIECL